MAAYETRLILFNRANSSGRLAQHWNALDRLERDMTMKIARADAFRTLTEQADAEFGLIERSTGEVRDPVLAAHGPAAGHLRLRALGQQLKQWSWSGAIYEKVSGYLCNGPSEGRLRASPKVARCGAMACSAMSRCCKRHYNRWKPPAAGWLIASERGGSMPYPVCGSLKVALSTPSRGCRGARPMPAAISESGPSRPRGPFEGLGHPTLNGSA